MAEFIEREAALNVLNGWRDQLIPTYGENDEYVKCLEIAAEYLESLHAADVRPVVRGKWIRMDMHKGMEQYKCAVCRSECYVPECMGKPMYAFCPNCGAMMEES